MKFLLTINKTEKEVIPEFVKNNKVLASYWHNVKDSWPVYEVIKGAYLPKQILAWFNQKRQQERILEGETGYWETIQSLEIYADQKFNNRDDALDYAFTHAKKEEYAIAVKFKVIDWKKHGKELEPKQLQLFKEIENLKALLIEALEVFTEKTEHILFLTCETCTSELNLDYLHSSEYFYFREIFLKPYRPENMHKGGGCSRYSILSEFEWSNLKYYSCPLCDEFLYPQETNVLIHQTSDLVVKLYQEIQAMKKTLESDLPGEFNWVVAFWAIDIEE